MLHLFALEDIDSLFLAHATLQGETDRLQGTAYFKRAEHA